jgi:hypothetical protein
MKQKNLKLFFILGLLLALVIPAQAVEVIKGPYLIFPGDNSQMTVLWQLDVSGTSTIEWGVDTGYTGGSIQTSEYGSDHQHKYTITSLTPGTKYYYRVTVAGVYHTGSFLAAPATTAADLKFLAYGDTRSYPADHDSVAAQMITTFTTDPAYQTLTLHVGDWVNNGDSENDWTSQFFPRTYSNIMEMQANLPIMGCMGNHEYSGVLFEKYYPYPFEPGGRYFSFDWGPLHVAIVDQYVSYGVGSTQYNWLENDLATTDREWKVIVLHEPGWSAGGHGNNQTVQQVIQPLCIQYGVDIVFAGHNHYYARAVVDGVQHVTTGGGGAPLYAPNANAEYVVAVAQEYHFCEMNIQGEQLDFLARDDSGIVLDTVTLSHVFVPALPWSDGFESGEFTTGGWMTSGQVTVQTDPYSGSYAARTDRTGTLTKSVSTESFTGIHVKYARKTSGLDAGEFLVVEWYDGSTWHELESTQDTAWAYKDFTLPAGADDNRLFKLRFSAVNADKKEYCFIDEVEVSAGPSGPDTTPPSPDPLTWATVPYATGSSSISMTATSATDPSGVEYYFECTAGGGHDSGWQDSTTYEDTGLNPETQYTYRVKARDKSTNQNETAFSSTSSATTLPAGGNEIFVNDITMGYQQTGPNYSGVATIWIKDTLGNDIEGATVSVTWSGSVSKSQQGVTGADGKITFTSPKNKNGGTFTITVTDVVKSGYTYNPSLNVETSDSITI